MANAWLAGISMMRAKVADDLTELKSGHVFRMRSLQDMFRKLHREKQRFEKAGSDEKSYADQIDAAINFAVTAWHMTDWAWERHQNQLGECFGAATLREFQDKMRQRYADLAVCDVIANAAKHGGTAHEGVHRPEIETVLVAHPIAEGGTTVELLAEPANRRWPRLACRRWSVRINVDGTSRDPLALLNSVFLLWHRFIQQHCV